MARFFHESSGIPPDLPALIESLNSHGVRYVLIGGMAMVIRGSTAMTADIDFAVSVDTANKEALVTALAPFHPVASHYPKGSQMVWDIRSAVGKVISVRTDIGDLDVLLHIPGIDSFEGLFERSEKLSVGDQSINVASIDDLIAMKRAAGRPKDLLHIDEFKRTQD